MRELQAGPLQGTKAKRHQVGQRPQRTQSHRDAKGRTTPKTQQEKPPHNTPTQPLPQKSNLPISTSRCQDLIAQLLSCRSHEPPPTSNTSKPPTQQSTTSSSCLAAEPTRLAAPEPRSRTIKITLLGVTTPPERSGNQIAQLLSCRSNRKNPPDPLQHTIRADALRRTH